MLTLITVGVILAIVLLLLLSSIKIVNTGYIYVVERLGQFHRILEPGWHFIIPGVDFVRKKYQQNNKFLMYHHNL